MDIPLHPKVVTEIARGRDFLDRIRSARRNIAGLSVTVPCPDGDNEIGRTRARCCAGQTGGDADGSRS